MTKITPGWLYKGPRYTEQNQGFYLPVMGDNENMYLLDTYMISARYSDDKNVSAMTEQALKLASEPNQALLNHVRANYYYASSGIYATRDNELPSNFEPICYLPDWEYVSDRNSEDYDEENVTGRIQLHFEHGYRWHSSRHGVMLKRKGAKRSATKELMAYMNDTMENSHAPYCSSYYLNTAKQFYDANEENITPELKMKYADFLKKTETLQRMQKEYHELLNSLS